MFRRFIKFFSEKKFKKPIFRRIALVIIVFVIMIGTSSYMAGDMVESRLSIEAESALTQTMLKLDADLTGPSTAVNIASETIRTMIMQGAEMEEVRRYLVEVSISLQSQKFGLDLGRMYGYFNTSDGGVFIDPLGDERGPDYDPTERPWYIAAKEAAGAINITQVFNSLQLNEDVISVVRRIYDTNGDPLGVISLDIPFQQLRAFVSDLKFSKDSEGSYGFLMNENFDIISHPNPGAEGLNLRDISIADANDVNGVSNLGDELKFGSQSLHYEMDDYNGDYSMISIADANDANGINNLGDELKFGSQPLHYEMDDYNGDYSMACSAVLSNGWILTLVTPVSEYYGELMYMEITLYALGTALTWILILMLRRLDRRTNERDEQLTKLAAVTQNYKGIVWSVDENDIITTMRGQTLELMGVDSTHFEGKPSKYAQAFLKQDFDEYEKKALVEGPQDWLFEKGDKTYHSFLALTRDDGGKITGCVGSIDDVTEEMALRQKLEVAVTEAEVANKAKSSFLANMSHEIRTPMNAILGITEILVQDQTLPSDIMEGLSKIYNSCGLLMGIINDILDFSKIEAGKLDIATAEYKIASMVNDSMHLNMMRIGSKPINFTLQIDEKIPAELIGDELRIKQILNNLLSNAFKYTDSGEVTLKVGFTRNDADSIKLILSVRDTGLGMSKEQVGKLFDEYSRFQSEKKSMIEGTGLGMAITQRLVYLMNGNISIESEPGKGSLFVITLPQGTVDDQVLGTELAENLRSFKTSLITSRERIGVTRDPMPYGKILIVDDVETNIYVAVGLLKLYGIQPDSASSGYEAIEKIKSGKVYDIIFMDHMMPGMDGIEATKRLRDLGYTHPIVALTANAVSKQADMFLQNGFDDFIAKPIDIRQLNSVLNRLVRDKQPPEVIEEARRQKGLLAVSQADAAKPELDPMLYASFVRDAKKAVTVLEEWHEELNKDEQTAKEKYLGQFTITVHGMKSALANIGETKLSSRAKDLEMAGKESNIDLIKQTYQGFLEALREIIRKAEPEDEGGDKDEDIPVLLQKLRDIQELCDDYDRKGATEALGEVDRKKCSKKLRETLDLITEAVLHSEFEEAGELAAAYANVLESGGQDENIRELKIDGLEVSKGLDKFGGDEDSYYKILRSYSSSLKQMLENTKPVEENTLPEYEITVHGIKGASRDIFAESVGRAAAGLEDAAKDGNLEFIRRHHQAFHEEAFKLAGEIDKLLNNMEAKTLKPKKDKPDAEALLKLLRACEVYDMDGADAALSEIDAYEYQADDGLVSWLRERAEVTDFSSIVQKLTGIV